MWARRVLALRGCPKKLSSGGMKQVTVVLAVAVRLWECKAWAKSVKPDDEREVNTVSEQRASMVGVRAKKATRRSMDMVEVEVCEIINFGILERGRERGGGEQSVWGEVLEFGSVVVMNLLEITVLTDWWSWTKFESFHWLRGHMSTQFSHAPTTLSLIW